MFIIIPGGIYRIILAKAFFLLIMIIPLAEANGNELFSFTVKNGACQFIAIKKMYYRKFPDISLPLASANG
jgi:hypothetical protein